MASLHKVLRALQSGRIDEIKSALFSVNDEFDFEVDSNGDLTITHIDDGTEWKLREDGNLETGGTVTGTFQANQLAASLRWGGGSSNQSIPDSTTTKVVWDDITTEDTDVVSVDLSNDEVTVQQDCRAIGYMYVSWSATADFGAGQHIAMRIDTNGSSYRGFNNPSVSDAIFSTSTPVTWLQLDEGDAISTSVRQTTGNTQTLEQGNFIPPVLAQFNIWVVG